MTVDPSGMLGSLSENAHGMAYLKQMSVRVLSELHAIGRERHLSNDSYFDSSDALKNEFLDVLESSTARAVSSMESLSSKCLAKAGLNFQTNDYLLIGRSGVLNQAVSELAPLISVGGWSSRLLAGNHWIFALLEEKFCDLTGFESCLYVSSGTLANQIIPQILAFPDVAFFSDSANHASLIDGIRLAKIAKERRFIFPHRDYEVLEAQLQASTAACHVIYCEGLYSMDGDLSDLKRLQDLAQRYRGVLVVDEAHSMGMFGTRGEGIVSSTKLAKENLIAMYTCGKSLATQGAFIVGPAWLRAMIINRGRSFIYTTAPSPLVAAATLVALQVCASLSAQREELSLVSGQIKQIIQERGYGVNQSSSHIVPLFVGRDRDAVELARELSGRGVLGSAIRPPTVPEGQSLIRFSLHTGLTHSHIERFAMALQQRKVSS